jgi:acyl-CoA synthetase (AMP-forming)/AMP-acid ligase II
VALMLENRPDHFLHMWALNGLGVSVVPVNADYMAHELAYQMAHSEADLAVVLARHEDRMAAAGRERGKALPVVVLERMPDAFPPPAAKATARAPSRDGEAAVIYTSGTTGRPKGCLIDNEFMFAVGSGTRRSAAG